MSSWALIVDSGVVFVALVSGIWCEFVVSRGWLEVQYLWCSRDVLPVRSVFMYEQTKPNKQFN